MNELKRFLIVFSLAMIGGSCGYTNQAILPNNIQTISVPTFKNEISQSDTFTHEAGIASEVTNAIIDRLNFDGNLKVIPPEEADAVLIGSVVRYDQETIRYEDRSDVKEYRLFVGVNLELLDTRTNETIWTERNFTGRTEFFRTGTRATSERAALISAKEDLAKKIVDRIVEDW